MNHTYLFDKTRRIWHRPGKQAFPYSDGDDAENYLLHTLKSAQDVSSSSTEIHAAIRDWPSEYHLSTARHNLLRFLNLGPAHKVLELGCGCGAMTRFLGESGARVIAVEGSARRAEIAAERCRDLPNVSIYCDNLIDFIPDEAADYVTLIGVLEYAPKFIDSDNPVDTCLRHSRSFLKDDGVLVLAIENQLGLKYFNGCAEDHTGIPYFGINNLYGPSGPVTFGRYELEARLRSAGFAELAFHYPFPDYKLPGIIVTEEALARDDFRAADLLYRAYSRDYGGGLNRAFHESLAWQTLARNGLLAELANSFLVLAHTQSTPGHSHAGWLARHYSTERLPAYAMETVLLPEDNGIVVTKQPLFPDITVPNQDTASTFRHRPSSGASYILGRLYVTELQPILARGGGVADVMVWAAPWVTHLAAMAQPGPDGTLVLPRECLDAVPANFVRDDLGALIEIDTEWEFVLPVPLAWVLIRGLVYSLCSSPCSPALASLTLREVVNDVLAPLGHGLNEADYRTAMALEDTLHALVYGVRRNGASLAEMLDRQMRSLASPPTYVEEIVALKNEIARVKNTVSWQITKPLRAIWNIGRKYARLWR